MSVAVIFGGTGFIGVHFAEYLLQKKAIERVVLADVKPLGDRHLSNYFRQEQNQSKIKYIQCDVRQPIAIDENDVRLIANFAAVHREPGHQPEEYYETNLLGAENVCAWADQVACKKIIFTSSIAPYGPTEEQKNEQSIPVPVSAYGGSKLAAEKMHIGWQKSEENIKQVVIVRPGVVFGPGEGGNVSRLIKAVLKRYFLYMGNQETRKAGTYVKELCNAMYWVLERQEGVDERVSLFNMSMNPGPSIKEYVDTTCEVANVKRTVPYIPYKLILAAAYCINFVAKPLGINHPFSPVRIKKLVRSNNIIPDYLVNNGYNYEFTLKEAFEDWKKECPEEWAK